MSNILGNENTSIKKKVNNFILTYNQLSNEEIVNTAKQLHDEIFQDKRLSNESKSELRKKILKIYKQYK